MPFINKLYNSLKKIPIHCSSTERFCSRIKTNNNKKVNTVQKWVQCTGQYSELKKNVFQPSKQLNSQRNCTENTVLNNKINFLKMQPFRNEMLDKNKEITHILSFTDSIRFMFLFHCYDDVRNKNYRKETTIQSVYVTRKHAVKQLIVWLNSAR